MPGARQTGNEMPENFETISISLPKLALDREAIAKRLRVPENSRKRDELWEMIDTIESMSAPAIHLRRLEPVFEGDEGFLLGNEKIASKSLGMVLRKRAKLPADGKPAVFAFAATCGQDASDWGNAREFGLPVFWAQTILEEGMLMLLDRLENELRAHGNYAVSHLEPGVPEDWPLDKQDAVFKLLGGTSEDFGIKPNDQSLMLPFRYVAGLAYFTDKILPQCGICHFSDCNKQRGGCWRLQAIKRKAAESGRDVDENV